MKTYLPGFGAAIALTAIAAVAQAADYYVATNGSASGAGTMAAPWTMAKAVGSTGAGPGDTVYIRGGTYNGAVNFTRSGNSGAWITSAPIRASCRSSRGAAAAASPAVRRSTSASSGSPSATSRRAASATAG